jgi:hypothetical protein
MYESNRNRAFTGALAIGLMIAVASLAEAGARLTVAGDPGLPQGRVDWSAGWSGANRPPTMFVRDPEGSESRLRESPEDQARERYAGGRYDFESNTAFIASRAPLLDDPASMAAVGLYSTSSGIDSLPSDSMMTVCIRRDRAMSRLLLSS